MESSPPTGTRPGNKIGTSTVPHYIGLYRIDSLSVCSVSIAHGQRPRLQHVIREASAAQGQTVILVSNTEIAPCTHSNLTAVDCAVSRCPSAIAGQWGMYSTVTVWYTAVFHRFAQCPTKQDSQVPQLSGSDGDQRPTTGVCPRHNWFVGTNGRLSSGTHRNQPCALTPNTSTKTSAT